MPKKKPTDISRHKFATSKDVKRIQGQKASKCRDCGHTMKDNLHGFDQNDAYLNGDKLVHFGNCTYCKFCNPVLAAMLNEIRIEKS